MLWSSRRSLRLLNGQATSRDAGRGLPFSSRSTVVRFAFSDWVASKGRQSTSSVQIAA